VAVATGVVAAGTFPHREVRARKVSAKMTARSGGCGGSGERVSDPSRVRIHERGYGVRKTYRTYCRFPQSCSHRSDSGKIIRMYFTCECLSMDPHLCRSGECAPLPHRPSTRLESILGTAAPVNQLRAADGED